MPGQHKVKVSGLMVSEEVGNAEGIRNHMAVEYVHDVSFQSKDATFDVSDGGGERGRVGLPAPPRAEMELSACPCRAGQEPRLIGSGQPAPPGERSVRLGLASGDHAR